MISDILTSSVILTDFISRQVFFLKKHFSTQQLFIVANIFLAKIKSYDFVNQGSLQWVPWKIRVYKFINL